MFYRDRNFPQYRYQQAAFTLIELLVTLAVAAVLTGLAAPAFTATMRRLDVTTATDNLQASMMLARSEAVVVRCPVFIQAKSSSWINGWEVFRDCDGNALKNNSNDVLSNINPFAKSLDIRGNSHAKTYLRFMFDGSSRQKSGALGMASITICPENLLSSPDCLRLTINATGRVRRWRPNLP
jgi:type IV fimbrial biogenesis protein FimT